MKVKSLHLSNFRSFSEPTHIEFNTINVLIGANNSGKSSILRALHLMQQGGGNGFADVRIGSSIANLEIIFDDKELYDQWFDPENSTIYNLRISINSADRRGGSITLSVPSINSRYRNVNQIPSVEPHHLIVPYLAKRKVVNYNEDVRNQHATQISPDLTFLAAKLARISNPSFPGYSRYSDTCKEILGFTVTAIPSDTGLRPGIFLPDKTTLAIDQMGEGVPHIAALLADLALSTGKLFLIEEPENDLHPSALKSLLDLIIDSSKSNQFIISTHSNIVLRHLGGIPGSKIYNITTVPDALPVEARIEPINSSPQARIRVLRDLGYTFSDFDVWDGWLILEESSAERIIRDYLIPWFAPKLSRVRTLAVGGISEVEPTFNDFQRLVRFTHLEQAYTDAAWVRVDGDTPGKTIVQKLRNGYPSWNPDRFSCFVNEQFEHYYPAEFSDKIAAALAVTDKQSRRDAKRNLLNEVRAWLDADSERGRAALLASAKEIIDDLQQIETQLLDGA
ncbi:ATP-dependent nuclease [Burkholderia cenocepacia]|uniref:ATP-dependent nuclease n=1 Tax=Burkholderia cenocepacia TaxID=95486 RepID=UPI001B9ACE46|nr:AAA family ATPase [Burkholderia cenocepacia]MBR8098522.1 AAA family ATPase [Burkholderia cenocepacia]MDI9690198.1 AAA family ATPase [Burkholderia cenocepacia]HEP6432446.1 AAA family ATPase [Burkholderia cenocepacia]